MGTLTATTTVTINLRLATKQDFISIHNSYKIGTMYFLKSLITGKFDSQPYYISQLTDKQALHDYKKNNQIDVPIGLFDECLIKEN